MAKKQHPPIPENEKERLKNLQSYDILDTIPETEFDNFVKIASHICGTPVALISLIDEDRQWFKAKVGTDVPQTPRQVSFCQYAIMDSELYEVEDARESEFFSDNPMVTGEPHIRFYAGHPIQTEEGFNIGTLCVIDSKPKKLNDTQRDALKALAEAISAQMQLRLRNLRKRAYKKFFDYSLDMLCIADTNGYFKLINPSFMEKLGYTEEELLSKPFIDYVHPDDKEKTYKEIERLSKGETTLNFSNRYRTKSGKYLHFNWTCKPDDKMENLYAVAHDITFLTEAEQELQSANNKLKEALRHKDDFLANMSHEIRTPMNAVVGFTDLLLTTKLDEKQREFVEAISTGGKHLNILINDLLDLSKLEEGKITIEQRPFSLKSLAQELVKLMKGKAKENNLKLITTIDEDLPDCVGGDDMRLSQILINLLANAIKFTEKGSVELRMMVEDKNENTAKVMFSVKDTGIGIGEDELQKVFERFEQASSSTARKYGGSGLGLNICTLLLSLYKSELNVKSEEGRGSEFYFTIEFPIANCSPQNTVIHIPLDEKGKLVGMNILLVEDNPLNQKLAINCLERNGANTEVAENGKIALEMVLNKDYDAILMDLQMPEMDGYAATWNLRNEMNIEIPIIACTAHSLVGEKEKCLAMGMNDYIAKPYNEATLVRSVQNSIREYTNKEMP